MKLLPDQLDHFWPGHPKLDRVHPDYPKLRAPVGGAGGFGRFAESPCPLTSIYLLDRVREAVPPSSQELSRGAATIELIRHSFVAEMIDAVDRTRGRIARIARMAATTPVRRLRFASGYDRLGSVIDHIVARAEGDVAEGTGEDTGEMPAAQEVR